MDETRGAVMHVHQLVVNTPNKREISPKTYSKCPKSDASTMVYFLILGSKMRPSPGKSETRRKSYHVIRQLIRFIIRTSRIIGSLVWPGQGAVLATQKMVPPPAPEGLYEMIMPLIQVAKLGSRIKAYSSCGPAL